MPDTWETRFGLNPNDPSDAALDSDGDGVSNLQEYLNGTNPKGTFKRYFAEGAANGFFTTRLGTVQSRRSARHRGPRIPRPEQSDPQRNRHACRARLDGGHPGRPKL